MRQIVVSVFDEIRPPNSPSLSDAAHGTQLLNLLDRSTDPRTTYFQASVGASIVPLENVCPLKPERALVQHLTPFLQAVFPNRVLVNSEEYPWLEVTPDRKHDQKPDVFFCHRACMTQKNKNTWCEDEALDREFGILTSMKLLEDVFIGDCKCKISAQAFGEIAKHLHVIAAELKAPVKGFLFDWESCWLLEVDPKGSIIQRIVMRWNQVRLTLRLAWRGPLIRSHSLSMFDTGWFGQ